MKVIKSPETVQNLAKDLAKAPHDEVKSPHQGMTYTEIPGLTDPTLDVLNQLNMNMKMLGELHLRLQFTIREIKSVLK